MPKLVISEGGCVCLHTRVLASRCSEYKLAELHLCSYACALAKLVCYMLQQYIVTHMQRLTNIIIIIANIYYFFSLFLASRIESNRHVLNGTIRPHLVHTSHPLYWRRFTTNGFATTAELDWLPAMAKLHLTSFALLLLIVQHEATSLQRFVRTLHAAFKAN